MRLFAAAAVAAALAGCGASTSGAGGSTTTAGSGAAAPGPQAPGTSTSGAGAGTIAANAPAPAHVNNSLIHQSAAPPVTQAGLQLGHANAPSVSGGSSGTVAAGDGAGVSEPGSKATNAKGKDTDARGPDGDDDSAADRGTRSAATTTSTQSTTSTQRTTSTPRTTSTTPTRLKVNTTASGPRVVVKVKTVLRDVIVHVPSRPSGPLTAFRPSLNPMLQQTQFVVAGGNVGCSLSGGALRCTVKRRVWTGPSQPVSCKSGWGNTISLPTRGAAHFTCGRASAISNRAKLIPNGWDDQLGRFTCQVRSIGVYCYSPSDHGLVISRSGFATY